jgi:hypothetical protein
VRSAAQLRPVQQEDCLLIIPVQFSQVNIPIINPASGSLFLAKSCANAALLLRNSAETEVLLDSDNLDSSEVGFEAAFRLWAALAHLWSFRGHASGGFTRLGDGACLTDLQLTSEMFPGFKRI